MKTRLLLDLAILGLGIFVHPYLGTLLSLGGLYRFSNYWEIVIWGLVADILYTPGSELGLFALGALGLYFFRLYFGRFFRL